MKNKITVEFKDFFSEIDNKEYYLRKIWLPQRLTEGSKWIKFKDEQLWFECYYIEELTMANPHRTAYIEFDFGMEHSIPLLIQDNFILRDMQDAIDEEKMAFSVIFDLFHAFHHPNLDPNYTVYHWALYGNLKDRVIIGDDRD